MCFTYLSPELHFSRLLWVGEIWLNASLAHLFHHNLNSIPSHLFPHLYLTFPPSMPHLESFKGSKISQRLFIACKTFATRMTQKAIRELTVSSVHLLLLRSALSALFQKCLTYCNFPNRSFCFLLWCLWCSLSLRWTNSYSSFKILLRYHCPFKPFSVCWIFLFYGVYCSVL